MAGDYLEAIDHISRLECGFATVRSFPISNFIFILEYLTKRDSFFCLKVKDVKDHRLENRMESFFLAETLKYLYLIFDKENFLHSDLSTDSHKIVKNNLGISIIFFFLFI